MSPLVLLGLAAVAAMAAAGGGKKSRHHKVVKHLANEDVDALLDDVDWFEANGDGMTGGALRAQVGRVADHKSGVDLSPVLAIDVDNLNQPAIEEWAGTLVSLEGRPAVLQSWAKAFEDHGAPGIAIKLRAKAKAIEEGTQIPVIAPPEEVPPSVTAPPSPNVDPDVVVSEPDATPVDPGEDDAGIENVQKLVADALSTGSVDAMREAANQLDALGYTVPADQLRARADEIESAQKVPEVEPHPSPPQLPPEIVEQIAEEITKPLPAPPPPPPPPPPQQLSVYIVQAGDTPSGVAEAFTGNPANWVELNKANSSYDISKEFWAGMKLKLPSRWLGLEPPKMETPHVQPMPDPTEPAPPTQVITTYTVKTGDNPSSVAQKLTGNPANWVELNKANPRYDLTKQFWTGMKLDLPQRWISEGYGQVSGPFERGAPKYLNFRAPLIENRRRQLAQDVARTVSQSKRYKENRNLVQAFQSSVGLPPHGKYDAPTAEAVANFGIVPPKPIYWNRNRKEQDAKRYRNTLLKFAERDPFNRSAWLEASKV